MLVPKIASEIVNRLPYAIFIFLWAILFAPISLGIFVMTSPHGGPLGLMGILILWIVMACNIIDEDPYHIDWKKRFEHWIFFPLVATITQAFIFGSSLWLSIVFLNSWFMMSRAWAAFVIPLWDAADRKDWKEFRVTLFTFIGGAPVLMLFYLPATYTVVMSIADSTSRLAGSNELLQKGLLALGLLGLLLDIALQSRPLRLRHETVAKR